MDDVNPGELRAVLDSWRARVSRYVRTQFELGTRELYVGNGHYVKNDPRPGWLVVDGRPCYSAAWL